MQVTGSELTTFFLDFHVGITVKLSHYDVIYNKTPQWKMMDILRRPFPLLLLL